MPRSRALDPKAPIPVRLTHAQRKGVYDHVVGPDRHAGGPPSPRSLRQKLAHSILRGPGARTLRLTPAEAEVIRAAADHPALDSVDGRTVRALRCAAKRARLALEAHHQATPHGGGA